MTNPCERLHCDQHRPYVNACNNIGLSAILLRPKMYVGDSPEAANSLAWFINGWLAANYGLGYNCSIMKLVLKPDPTKTLEENAIEFAKELKEQKFLPD